MKYLCSNCSVVLSKEDLKQCEVYALGKLYCFNCLSKQVSKFNTFSDYKVLKMNDEEFEKHLKETEEDLVGTMKEECKWEKY